MTSAVVLSYAARLPSTLGSEVPPGGMAPTSITLLLFGFFLLSFAIAAVAVLAGIDGRIGEWLPSRSVRARHGLCTPARLGGFAGAHVLIRVQSASIRCILIGIPFYTTCRSPCKNPRGTGVSPVNHGQDARATSDEARAGGRRQCGRVGVAADLGLRFGAISP